MRKNDVVRLEIESLTNEGFGVGRYDGMAVFVPFSAPGDVCECRILKVLKSYCYAKIEKITTPSPDRITPDCEAFGKCGGCDFRHINYACELNQKEKTVRDAFLRVGGLDVPCEKIISTGETDFYRNKAQLPLSDAGGIPYAGFFSPRSHRVIPAGSCRLHPKIFNDIIDDVLAYQKDRGLSCYSEERGNGLLRHIYLRQGYRSGEIMLCLIVRKNTEAYDGLFESLPKKFPEIKTCVLNINPKNTNVILGDKTVVKYGSGILRDEISGVGVELSPESFYQINTAAAELVYKKAEEYSGLTGKETVLDLYCGAGTVGLSMAGKIKRLIGVEIVPEAVENARENAKRNNIENAEFRLGDAGEIAEQLEKERLRPDVILIDPPRKGCDKRTLDSVIRMSPGRVVMISCNPATAARDVKYLSENGFTAEKICPADMFPRTRHVETVCLLSKLNVKQHIEVELTMDEMDLTAAEKKASYEEIKEYVLEKFGMKVSHLYIAQVKRKCGIIERENYNKPKSESAKQPQCPPEKEAAIRAALEYFRMI